MNISFEYIWSLAINTLAAPLDAFGHSRSPSPGGYSGGYVFPSLVLPFPASPINSVANSIIESCNNLALPYGGAGVAASIIVIHLTCGPARINQGVCTVRL